MHGNEQKTERTQRRKLLDGNDIQTYANDLFKQLGIGQKKQDNGVMLLVAPNERKYWTEVGYGLEPVINDVRAGVPGYAGYRFDDPTRALPSGRSVLFDDRLGADGKATFKVELSPEDSRPDQPVCWLLIINNHKNMKKKIQYLVRSWLS